MRQFFHVPQEARQHGGYFPEIDPPTQPGDIPSPRRSFHDLPSDARRTLWLDASDLKTSGAFDRWTDRVGGLVFRQTANTSYRPIARLKSQNDLAVADFTDGAFLTCDELHHCELIAHAQGTLTFLARHTNQSSGGGCFLTNITHGGLGFYMAQTTTAYYDHGAGGGSTTRLNFAITRDPDWCVYQLVKRGEVMYYYRDGVLLGSGTGKSGSLPNNKSYAILGHDNRTTSPVNIGSRMDVAELRLYNRALTDGQLLAERQELRKKWRLDYKYSRIEIPNTTAQWDASQLGLSVGANVTNFAAIVGGTSYDLSTVVSSNPTYQEKNGCPGVRYAAGYHRTNAATGLVQPMNNTDWSIFAVIGCGVQTQAYACVIDHTHTTPSGQNFVLARYDSNDSWTCAYYRSSGGTVEALGPAGAVAWRGQGRMVVAVNKNGTAYTIRNGRRAVVPLTLGASTYTSAARQLNFAGNPTFGRQYIGDIHEVIICNAAQPDADMDFWCKRLADKWGAAL